MNQVCFHLENIKKYNLNKRAKWTFIEDTNTKSEFLGLPEWNTALYEQILDKISGILQIDIANK